MKEKLIKDLLLYGITHRKDQDDEDFLNQLEEALQGGLTMVQVREKGSDDKEFYEIAKKVKELCNKYEIPIIVNDNIDIAMAIDADGIHLGLEDEAVSKAREVLGKRKIIGATAKTVEEAQKAEQAGADYLGSGALFTSSSKKEAKTISKDQLKEIATSVEIPVVGIGGIDEENVDQLEGTGIVGVSVIGAIFNAEDTKEATRRLRKKVEDLF